MIAWVFAAALRNADLAAGKMTSPVVLNRGERVRNFRKGLKK